MQFKEKKSEVKVKYVSLITELTAIFRTVKNVYKGKSTMKTLNVSLLKGEYKASEKRPKRELLNVSHQRH